jgi:hypothetical protein
MTPEELGIIISPVNTMTTIVECEKKLVVIQFRIMPNCILTLKIKCKNVLVIVSSNELFQPPLLCPTLIKNELKIIP